MVSYKFLAATVLGLALISAVTSGGMNTCGTVGDAMPANSSDCLSDQDIVKGAKCCYMSAISRFPITNTTVESACALLPPGNSETIIKHIAENMGINGTYTCNSSYMAVSTLLLFVFALMF
jgi:hypothetical protein